ncbi:MAG TPA: hypothetical protein VHB48_16745 [Chitinophagaceae bacterium]|nr:hypothetical protein [Chitinophagaceae bacterium]
METQKKILLVQLFSYGDCLYATAVARQIKQDYPGCHLTWAIASFCKDILNGNPYVDEVRVVNDAKKNDAEWYRNFEKEILKEQSLYQEIFITNALGKNQAYYNGCIRSNIFNAYPHKITVPVSPVVRLNTQELQKAADFANKHNLTDYKHVVLFEYAPQSGQSALSKDFAITVAEKIFDKTGAAVILSSANKVLHKNIAIIDGSALTFRETAALTHYCTFLIGSSSGITWISTSDAARQLPMVQLLNANAFWANPVSRDFKRFGLPVNEVIELVKFDTSTVINCVSEAFNNFLAAKEKYNQEIPLKFKSTRRIVYNLLVYREFGAIIKHIQCNNAAYGLNINFYTQVGITFIIFPIKLIRNIFVKRILGKAVK